VHGIFEQVLDEFAAEDGREVLVGVREAVLLGVEVVDVAGEGFAPGGGNDLVVDLPEPPVLAAANIDVAELAFERRRDLHVCAHFEDAVARAAVRRDFEGLREAGLMRIEI